MNNNNQTFEEEFDSNLEESPETMDLESGQYEELLEEVPDQDLPYEELLIDTASGDSFIYDLEDGTVEEISRSSSQNYLKEFIMEYQNGWRENDLDQPIPGAEAYMFRI